MQHVITIMLGITDDQFPQYTGLYKLTLEQANNLNNRLASAMDDEAAETIRDWLDREGVARIGLTKASRDRLTRGLGWNPK